MNTPTHALINCAVVPTKQPSGVWAVAAGALLPDVPIYLFYVYEKFHLGLAEAQIWQHDYSASAVQPVIDSLHSFPLAAALLGVGLLRRSDLLKAFAASLLLHAGVDFLVHHDDAHRQFFPFSGYRFLSPISYWDPRHHGAFGAALEFACAAASVTTLVRGTRDWRARAAWVTVWLLDLLPFLMWA